MSEPHRPVFVDPSGRRRQLVRVLAVVGAVLVAGYLLLVLIAAVGGPSTPAARLPLLPEHPPAANPGPAAETPTLDATTTAEPSMTVNQPKPTVTTTASAPVVAPVVAPPPPAITSSRQGRASRPSEPPGNGGGPHTSPPGHGG